MKLFHKQAPQAVQSFKQRVQTFWSWYASHSKQIFELVDSNEAPEVLTDLLVPQIDQLGPGFGWVFGPGDTDAQGNAGGHSLTLTPEGVLSHQYLADFWREMAPELSGWTFHSSRQRSTDLDECGFRIGEISMSASEVLILPNPDPQTERLDIEVWHPLFPTLPEQAQYQILFLLLDEALGEHGTATLIGDIAFAEEPSAGVISLAELREHALQVFDENEWTLAVPAKTYALLTLEPIDGEFLRSDVFTISSSYPDLVLEYLNRGGAMEDPVEENGATFVFLDIPRSFFPAGEETHLRGEIEDAINERLTVAASGALIGGSAGQLAMYSDFVLFDSNTSVEIIRQAMVDLKLPSGSSLNYFGGSRQAFVL